MAGATKAQASQDLWHLSIDDLFASPAAVAPGALAGPFVINLSLSSAPSGAMPRGMPRFERLCIFQLKRPVDERRDEFRLRLGIIETELEADAILAAVREHYPAARKESASEEDTRAVALRASRAAKRAAAVKRSEPKVPRTQKRQPPAALTRDVMLRAKPSPAVAPVPWNVDDVLPQFAALDRVKCEPVAPLAASAPAAPVATPVPASDPIVTPVAPPSASASLATPVVPPADEPTVEVEVWAEPPPAPAVNPAVQPVAVERVQSTEQPVPPTHHDIDSDPDAVTTEVEAPTFTIEAPLPAIELRGEELDVIVAAPPPAPPVELAPPTVPSTSDSGTIERLVARIDALVDTVEVDSKANAAAPPPDAREIDSTRTERALTPLELSTDDDASRWFVVQLVLSEHEIEPEQVPSLDIYNEYRLYRVTGLDQGRVMHALRLGFFGSEPAAQAVAGYLAVFFDSPSITRVSIAERERFADDRMAAHKDVGATGKHSTIELTSPAPLPERREPEIVPQERGKNSLWSRIVAPLKR